ncbi:carbohydrate kinase family protein [Kosmotoga pacifica]|uniref:Carbohydrate kinase PfkB domain-containing protein n=1 Tax=Kosmotoga pacifica TaxID=1330330 RepID=A0A0G2ZAF5_9BACT|nr:carbohydrate kinase family protein [Kosmotoga pacifica]AKI97071.1 hypothetical protein IX53_03675 [Kosmotoga pacifica]
MIQVIGNINFDVTAILEKVGNVEESRILDLQPGIGGTASNTAIQLSKLGRRVILSGAVGKDIFGLWLLEELGKQGIDVGHIKIVDDERTGFCFVSVRDDGHRFLFTHRGINEKLLPEIANPARTTFLHLAGVSIAQAEHVLNSVHRDIPISYAPGGIVSFEKPEGVIRLSSKVTYLILNEREWESIGGFGTPESRYIIVTKGANGAEVLPEGILVPSYKVKAVDTTGAGDAFNAGFIHVLSSGGTLKDAVKFGNVLGALNVQYRGALGNYGLNEIRDFISLNEPALTKYI